LCPVWFSLLLYCIYFCFSVPNKTISISISISILLSPHCYWEDSPRLYDTAIFPTIRQVASLGHCSRIKKTRTTLDCDQSNYSLRIVFSHIPIEFGQTGISAIRSADLENPTVEPKMKWIGQPLAEIWPFEIFKIERSFAGRSVLNIYTVLLLTLISYTPLCYVRNVAKRSRN